MTGQTESPPIQEAILKAIRTEVAKIRTMLPGRILSYDHDDQRASVQPTVKLARENPETGEREKYMPEPIENVPVAFPSGGGFAITFPLQKGDRVELQFASRSLDEWLASDADEAEPVDPRRFDISDAVARPGIRAFANAIASDKIDDSAIVVSGKELHLGKADPANWAARDDRVEAELEKIVDYLKDFRSSYNSHAHTRADNTALIPIPAPQKTSDTVTESAGKDGDLVDQPAGSPPSVDDVASDKVKAE